MSVAPQIGHAAQNVPTMDVGPMTAYPIATANFGYSSNALQTPDGNQESWIITGALGAGLQGERRGHFYGLEYEGIFSGYSESSDDSFFNSRVSAYGGHAFNLRNNIDFAAEYLDWKDPRSQDDPTQNRRYTLFSTEPDEWHSTRVGANYVYGAPNARGRFECAACQTWLRFDNNGQELRDRDVLDLGASLAARVSPKTDLLVGITYTDFDYINQDPQAVAEGLDINSVEMRYYAGAEWDITPKTAMSLQVGLLNKDFDDNSSRSDYSRPFWVLDLEWSPRGRTNLLGGYSRYLYESVAYYPELVETSLDDYVEVESLHAAWDEQWTPRLFSNVTGYVNDENYSPGSRSDDVYGVFGNVTYHVNRWLGVGVNAYYRQRDSSERVFDYEDKGVGLTLNLGGLLGWGAKAPPACNVRRLIPNVRIY